MGTFLKYLLCVGIMAQSLIGQANAQEGDSGKVAWIRNVEQARVESRRTGKPVLLQITASWCGYCHKMLNETFQNANVAHKINQGFVPLLIDADESAELVEALKINSFPSTIIVSADLSELGRLVGFQQSDALCNKLAEFRVAVPVAIGPGAGIRVQSTRMNVAPPPVIGIPSLVSRPISNRTIVAELGRNPTTQPQVIPPSVPAKDAFDGKCLVTMLEVRKPVDGSAKFTCEFRGSRLQFASSEQLAKFKAQPSKYWPWLDGRCPVTLFGQDGSAAPGDDVSQTGGHPQFGGVFSERLIFFRNDAQRAEFSKRPQFYLPTGRKSEA